MSLDYGWFFSQCNSYHVTELGFHTLSFLNTSLSHNHNLVNEIVTFCSLLHLLLAKFRQNCMIYFLFMPLPFILITAAWLLSFSSVQFSPVWLFRTSQTSTPGFLSITNSWRLLKLMSIVLVMPSNHLILCHPLLLLPSIFPNIRVFSNESVLCIGSQSIGVSASASVPPMNIQGWFPLGWTGLISLQSKGLSRVFNTTAEKHQQSHSLCFPSSLGSGLCSISLWLCVFFSVDDSCISTVTFCPCRFSLYSLLMQPSKMILLRITSLLCQIFCESVTIRVTCIYFCSVCIHLNSNLFFLQTKRK